MTGKTYKQVIRMLSLSNLLYDFLTSRNFLPSEAIEFKGAKDRKMTKALIAEIEQCDDINTLKAINRDLVGLLNFKSQYADDCIYDAISSEKDCEEIKAELEPLHGAIERALWLLVNRPEILREASFYIDFDIRQKASFQFQMEQGKPFINTDEAIKGFKRDISDFFVKKRGYGQDLDLQITKRTEDIYHLHLELKGHLESVREYKEHGIVDHDFYSVPCIALEFVQSSGILEFAERTAAVQTAVVKAFAKHFLDSEMKASAIRSEKINLAAVLHEKVETPNMKAYDIDMIEVRRVRVRSGSGLEYDVRLTDKNAVDTMYDMLLTDLGDPVDDFCSFEVKTAWLKFHFTEGQQRYKGRKEFTLKVESSGKKGWDALDEKEREALGAVLDALQKQAVEAADGTNG